MSSKRIGFVSTRLAGTDGVSLETAKLTLILEQLGHDSFYCAGELDPVLAEQVPLASGNIPEPMKAVTPHVVASMLIPEMHFTHPAVISVHDAAFGNAPPPANLRPRIAELAASLKTSLRRFVTDHKIDLLFIQNALAIPMNIPLGVALTDFIEETGIPALTHNHDFYWERKRFEHNHIPDILSRCFPPELPSLRHIVINSIAQAELIRRKHTDSVVLPNIFDFAHAAPGPDIFNQDLRRALGLTNDHLFVLQPTRVIPRKGIELTIEFVRRMRLPENLSRLEKEPVLVITHPAGDEGVGYLREMQHLAKEMAVPLLYAAEQFAPQRAIKNGKKIYSLWDAYIYADFVTYPSLLEGFGNALIESIYFRLPALVNRYEVYVRDIAPLGFDFVEVNGRIADQSVETMLRILTDSGLSRRSTQWNYQLAKHHFSYEAVKPILETLIN